MFSEKKLTTNKAVHDEMKEAVNVVKGQGHDPEDWKLYHSSPVNRGGAYHDGDIYYASTKCTKCGLIMTVHVKNSHASGSMLDIGCDDMLNTNSAITRYAPPECYLVV